MLVEEVQNRVCVRLADGSHVDALLPDGLSAIAVSTPRAACKVLVYSDQVPDSSPRRELPDARKNM